MGPALHHNLRSNYSSVLTSSLPTGVSSRLPSSSSSSSQSSSSTSKSSPIPEDSKNMFLAKIREKFPAFPTIFAFLTFSDLRVYSQINKYCFSLVKQLFHEAAVKEDLYQFRKSLPKHLQIRLVVSYINDLSSMLQPSLSTTRLYFEYSSRNDAIAYRFQCKSFKTITKLRDSRTSTTSIPSSINLSSDSIDLPPETRSAIDKLATTMTGKSASVDKIHAISNSQLACVTSLGHIFLCDKNNPTSTTIVLDHFNNASSRFSIESVYDAGRLITISETMIKVWDLRTTHIEQTSITVDSEGQKKYAFKFPILATFVQDTHESRLTLMNIVNRKFRQLPVSHSRIPIEDFYFNGTVIGYKQQDLEYMISPNYDS